MTVGKKSLAIASIGLMGLTGAGCGGGSKKAKSANTSPVAPTPKAGSNGSSTTIAATTKSIDQTVWFTGFKVTLKTASLTPNEGGGGGVLSIDTVLNNLGTDNASLDAKIDLASGDNHYPGDESDLKEVPGKAQGAGKISFIVDDKFSMDKAVVKIGSAAHNQAVVPLGSTGKLVTLEPLAVPLTGTVSAGVFKMTIKSAELRADIPTGHTQLDAGKRELLVTYDMADTAPAGGGGVNLQGDAFNLKMPDGNSVVPDEAPNEILEGGGSKLGLVLGFPVTEPASGKYTLNLLGQDDKSEKVTTPFDFTITEPPAA